MTIGSWLCPTELDRNRVAEASPRVRRARLVAAGTCGLALVASAPWIGWWILIPFAVGAVNLASFEWRFSRSDHPERVAAESLLLFTLLLAVGVALSGGPDSPAMPWLAIPVGLAATRFRPAVVRGYAGLTALLLLFATAGVDPAATASNPVPLLVTLSLLAGIAAVASALIVAELTHRDAAVLDPLTGLLNRSALEPRMVELEQQAVLTGDWVCFVACDVDRFKAVNDKHGHEWGDAVLKTVAYQLRQALRSFELIYRLGGDEFLIVLPAIGPLEGREIAERLCRTLAASHSGGLEVTMSGGVSAARGADVRYQTLLRKADDALYEAKRNGRDRVVVADRSAGEHAEDPERRFELATRGSALSN